MNGVPENMTKEEFNEAVSNVLTSPQLQQRAANVLFCEFGIFLNRATDYCSGRDVPHESLRSAIVSKINRTFKPATA